VGKVSDVAALFLFAGALLAQVTTGSISGYLFDPSGKVVPHSVVTATVASRSFIRETVTDETGFYCFPEIAPSTYEISASAQGFQKAIIRGLVVEVNAHLRIDLRVPVAGPEQAIEFTSTPQQIPTNSSDLSTVLNRQKIQSLPLNRRDFLQLSLLTPGSLPPVEDSELSSRGAFAMHANGADRF
jgi:hypothetical protein